MRVRFDRQGRDVTDLPGLHGPEDVYRIEVMIPVRLFDRVHAHSSRNNLSDVESAASLLIAKAMRDIEMKRQRGEED